MHKKIAKKAAKALEKDAKHYKVEMKSAKGKEKKHEKIEMKEAKKASRAIGKMAKKMHEY